MYCIFFAFFIIVGSFVMNLFVGVTIDKFNEMKEKQEVRACSSPPSRNWVSIQKLLVDIRPMRKVAQPENKIRRAIFSLVITRSLAPHPHPHHPQHHRHGHGARGYDVRVGAGLFITNTIFAAVFLCEAVLKLIAFLPRYFGDAWNSFDFGVVCLSVVSFVITVATDVSAVHSASSRLH